MSPRRRERALLASRGSHTPARCDIAERQRENFDTSVKFYQYSVSHEAARESAEIIERLGSRPAPLSPSTSPGVPDHWQSSKSPAGLTFSFTSKSWRCWLATGKVTTCIHYARIHRDVIERGPGRALSLSLKGLCAISNLKNTDSPGVLLP